MAHHEVASSQVVKKPVYRWTFQEWTVEWGMWGFGREIRNRGGWDMDEKTVFLGPLRFRYLSSAQMDGI